MWDLAFLYYEFFKPYYMQCFYFPVVSCSKSFPYLNLFSIATMTIEGLTNLSFSNSILHAFLFLNRFILDALVNTILNYLLQLNFSLLICSFDGVHSKLKLILTLIWKKSYRIKNKSVNSPFGLCHLRTKKRNVLIIFQVRILSHGIKGNKTLSENITGTENFGETSARINDIL